jgi:hypothetical protein
MADEVIGTYSEGQINTNVGAIPKIWCKANGSTLKPGLVVTRIGETFSTKDVALIGNATFDTAYGVLERRPELDIDTVFADDLMVPVWRVGSNEEVWVFLKTSALTAVYPGTPLYAPVDGGGAVDVLIRPLTTGNATATHAAIARYHANCQTYVGISEDNQAVSAGGWTVIKIRLTGVGGGVAGGG